MDQTNRVGREDRHARWVAMWQEAVRTNPLPVGLVQLVDTSFVEMSDRAAELLRTTPARGVGLQYLSVTDRPREAAQTFRLVRERMLDGIQGRRLFHKPDGSSIELQLTGWAIRSSTGPDLGLWIAAEVPEADGAGVDAVVVAPATWNHTGTRLDGAQITLDERWRVAHISARAGAVLGESPSQLLGASILELTHKDDLAALLVAFARATTDVNAEVQVRLCRGRTWQTVRAVITHLEGDGTLPYSVIASPAADSESPGTSGASQLAGDLRRIASQIEAAGMLVPLMETPGALGVPTTADLSPRQWEIASRLIQGERVATIATDMYLSQSTVRNHLSAIFQKFGVHSQRELLALWRGGVKRSVRDQTT